MILKVYSLVDRLTGVHSHPFYMAHDQHAVRAAIELAKDRSTQVGKYPHDFELVRLGEFDDVVGVFGNGHRFTFGLVSALVAQGDEVL